MNAPAWYMIFIGFLGSDVQPSYALILDDVPLPAQAACAKRAEGANTEFVRNQKIAFPSLEGFWVCATDKKSLSLTEANIGWRLVWTGYKENNDWATTAIITSTRYMTEQECYRATGLVHPPTHLNLTWEALCAEPITGQLN